MDPRSQLCAGVRVGGEKGNACIYLGGGLHYYREDLWNNRLAVRTMVVCWSDLMKWKGGGNLYTHAPPRGS